MYALYVGQLFSSVPHAMQLLSLIQDAHARSARPLPAPDRAAQRAQL